MERNVEISIIVLAYNHARFIEKALDSILMQEIDVPYEIIVHDDVSTDGTRDILKKYAKAYPDKIRLYLRKTKANRVTYASCQMHKKAKGKYIATLEGDDYWIDREKLKKQYCFLESNPQYIGVTHKDITVNINGDEIKDRSHMTYYNWKGVYTIEDYWYSLKMPGQTATMMCKNIFKDKDISIIYKGHDIIGDKSRYLVLLTEGNIYRMDDIMSARRVVRKKGESNWNSIALERDLELERAYLTQRQLEWYQKTTGNYRLVQKKWIEEWKNWWNYLMENGLGKHKKERMHLLFCLTEGIVVNRVGILRNYILRKTCNNFNKK